MPLLSRRHAPPSLLVQKKGVVQFGGFQDPHGLEAVLVAPLISRAAPGIGALIKIDPLGVVQLPEAVLPGTVKPQLHGVLTRLGLNL